MINKIMENLLNDQEAIDEMRKGKSVLSFDGRVRFYFSKGNVNKETNLIEGGMLSYATTKEIENELLVKDENGHYPIIWNLFNNKGFQKFN